MLGLLLAAGAGRRFGAPKGLLADPDGTAWVQRAVRALADGGCAPVLVVLGAEADLVARLVPVGAEVVRAEDWAEGMGASLRAGLQAALASVPGPVAALVALVDMPGVGADVVQRMLQQTRSPGAEQVLARAGYRGLPGHPVLLGRAHWPGVIAAAAGDRGARDYLAGRDVALVECADVGDGRDVDTPAEAPGATPLAPRAPH